MALNDESIFQVWIKKECQLYDLNLALLQRIRYNANIKSWKILEKKEENLQ